MRRSSQLLVCSALLLSSAGATTYLSPRDVDWSKDGKFVYVTAQTGKQVLCFDPSTRAVAKSIPLPGEPTELIQRGDALLVTGGGPNGRVWMIEADEISRELRTGHSPISPVLSPDGETLYVCNRFDNDVSFIDLESGETIARVPVAREPIASDLSRDGTYLFVANHIPDGRADSDYMAAKISVINTETRAVKTIPLVNGAEGLRGLKVSPDGTKVYATHQVARFLVPTTQLERGWVSTDALSVIDVASQTLEHTVLLDDVDQGFPNPWALGFSSDGKTLVVSSAGIHEISLIDLPALTAKIAAARATSENDARRGADNDLSFLSGIRRRIKLEGLGPRALAVEGNTVYIGNYFSDTLEVIRFNRDGKTRGAAFPLGPKQSITAERQGEIYFNDARLCFQNWLSCATCHPDARTDGLNWDLLNDGIGNPKNAKSMLLAHETPRAMWLGVRPDAEAGVRAGLTHIQFSVRPEADAQAIDAYLRSLKPVPSPHLVDGALSESARRGRNLFNDLGCARCHPAPLYTDLKTHQVGTTKGQDAGREVDVPSLVELWRTAPYLHDGRAATIQDLLKTHDHAHALELTGSLSEQERDDLAEYLLSL